MSAGDQDLFGTMIKVENKDIFVDLKKNSNGVYLKLSERNGKSRKTILIPASGIGRLKSVLEEVLNISATHTEAGPERRVRSSEHPEVLSRSVYVSGLAWTTTSEALAAHFQQVGAVEKAVILNKTRNGKTISLGCGVVEFHTAAQAALAVSALSNTELDGRVVKCREDRSIDSASGGDHSSIDLASRTGGLKPSKGAGEGSRVLDPMRVFITSLPWESTSTDLVTIFGTVGRVVSAEVLCTKKGRSLGHAVVEYADALSAARAVAELNGREVQGRCMIVREYYME